MEDVRAVAAALIEVVNSDDHQHGRDDMIRNLAAIAESSIHNDPEDTVFVQLTQAEYEVVALATAELMVIVGEGMRVGLNLDEDFPGVEATIRAFVAIGRLVTRLQGKLIDVVRAQKAEAV